MKVLVAACTLLLGCHGWIPWFGDDKADAALDATIPIAGGWGEPMMVTLDRPPGTYATDPSFMADGSRAFYAVTAIGGSEYDIYEAPMTSPTMGGTRKAVLANAGIVEASPEISPDGLSMLFLTFEGTMGRIDSITRPSLIRQWTAPTTPADLNSPDDDRPGNVDMTKMHVVVARGERLVELAQQGGMWVEQPTTDALQLQAREPQLSTDGLTLVFAAQDPGGSVDLFVAVRDAIGSPWSMGYEMSVSDPEMAESDPWLAPSGKRLYFTRGATIFMSERP